VTQGSMVDVLQTFQRNLLPNRQCRRLDDGDSGFLRRWRLSSRTRLHGVISQM